MKNWGIIIFACLFVFAFLTPAQAESELEALKREIRRLQDRVNAVEIQQEEPSAYFTSYLGDKIKIGGELEFNYVDTQDGEATHPKLDSGHPEGRFFVDKVRLKCKIKPTENIEFKFKLDFDPEEETVELDEGYITFEDVLPLEGAISAGAQDRFIAETIESYTEGDSMAETAFWNKPDLGIQYKGKCDPFYWYVSVSNGMILDDKQIGEDKGKKDYENDWGKIQMNDIIEDDTLYEDVNNNKQVGVGLGYATFGEWGNLDILGFGYFSELSQGELDDLLNDTDCFPDRPAGNTRETQRRSGFNLAYTKDAFEFYVQYIRAQDGWLRRHAWFVQPSYKFDVDWRYLKAIQPLYRYGQYLVSHRPSLTNSRAYPLTWDRKRHTLALINYIRENLALKLEYAINEERTGGKKPRNNEFIAQLEYKF